MYMKLSPAKKASLVILMVLSFCLRAQQTDKKYFLDAKNEIENMLNGTKPLDYEKAVFIMENAYYDNKLNYEDFQFSLNVEQYNVEYLINKLKSRSLVKPRKNILVSTDSETVNINRLTANYAIYKYITNVTFNKIDSTLYMHHPYGYAVNDPLAATDWGNTQVINLIANNGTGNCMALTSLFKILSLRFNSNANLCTTQGHIFITHADENGRLYNVELGSKAFPGTGSIETITHTTDEAARNGISMRELDLKQSVAICLINLAKGYQHKFLTKPDAFMFDCANLILKYDSLNLNAMLLKAEVLEENLISQQKPFAKIKVSKDFIEYEKYINRLYKLGYREMPTEMKNQIIAAITQDTTYLSPIRDRTFDSFENIVNNKSRSASLSNGMFEEFDVDKPQEKYFRTVFDTKTKKIIAFQSIDRLYNKYEFDPVAFAWQIDPLTAKYPYYSPYSAFGNNPIWYVDTDGRENIVYLVYLPSKDSKITKQDAYDMAEKANINFANLGLNTRVVVVDKSITNGKEFNPGKIDATDVVAVVGQVSDVKAYINKYNTQQNYKDDLATWEGGANAPELSENYIGGQDTKPFEGGGNFIAIDANGIEGWGKNQGYNKAQAGGFILNHGAGHNSDYDLKLSHRPGGIMTDGNDFQTLTPLQRNYGVITSNLPNKEGNYKIGRNQALIDHVRQRFGTSQAKVNYNGKGTVIK